MLDLRFCGYEQCRLLGCGVVLVYYKPMFQRKFRLHLQGRRNSASESVSYGLTFPSFLFKRRVFALF
jgi:hypothetical protein